MIEGQNFFDQPVKDDIRTCDNIQNVTSGRGDDYTTDYPYFDKRYKMISIDLSKQQALDVDPKPI